MLSSMISTGRIVDIVIVFMVVEACLLLVYHRKTGKGLPFTDMSLMLLAGLPLLLALRVALIGGPWELVAVWLSAALAAHLADLWRRFQHSRKEL